MPMIPLWKFCNLIFDAIADCQILYGIIKYGQKQPQMNLGSREENEAQMHNFGKSKIVCMSDDVWFEVFDFVERIQLARTVSLTNRHIHQICWPRLHGNRVKAHKVQKMTIRRHGFWGQSATAVLSQDGVEVEVPIPTCPPPAYISRFREIHINFLNAQVLQFLSIISRMAASCQIDIDFLMEMSSLDEKLYVNELVNIFRGGELSKICRIYCPLANIQYLTEMDNKVQLIRLISVNESDIPLLMKMLATPRSDGQQKVYFIHLNGVNDLAAKILDTIQKEFRASTQPLPQPFCITVFHANFVIPPKSVEENRQTDEQLTIINSPSYMDICRHPTGQFERWEEDERERILKKAEIKLTLDFSADHTFCGKIFCPVNAVRKLYAKLLELMG